MIFEALGVLVFSSSISSCLLSVVNYHQSYLIVNRVYYNDHSLPMK